MYISCVYCGHRYGPKDKVPATAAETLKAHVERCPKHPMSHLHAKYNALRDEVQKVIAIIDNSKLGSQCGECGQPVNPMLDNAVQCLEYVIKDDSGGGSLKESEKIIDEVLEERRRQNEIWGEQNHHPERWLMILGEEVGEVNKAALENYWPSYREELIQVAAVATAAVESLDRGKWEAKWGRIYEGDEWRTDRAFCRSCGHKWQSVTPVDCESLLECPTCGNNSGMRVLDD